MEFHQIYTLDTKILRLTGQKSESCHDQTKYSQKGGSLSIDGSPSSSL